MVELTNEHETHKSSIDKQFKLEMEKLKLSLNDESSKSGDIKSVDVFKLS